MKMRNENRVPDTRQNEVRKKESCHEVNEVRRDRKRRSSGMNELSYTCGSDLYGACERRGIEDEQGNRRSFCDKQKRSKVDFARTMDKLIQCMTMLMLLWLIVICGVYIVKMCNGEISTLLGLTAMGCVTTAVAAVIALVR